MSQAPNDHTFHSQFLLARNGCDHPSEFVHCTFGQWNLYSHPTLPVHRLVGYDRSPAGLVIGFPIKDSKLLCEPTELRIPSNRSATGEGIDALLRELSGRYLVLLLGEHPLAPRVYPDAFASLSMVYSEDRQVAASTTSLLHYHAGAVPTYPLGVFPDTGFHYYSGGLTDCNCCRRLLPNHSLDLASWTSSRFWPKEGIVPCSQGEEDVYVRRAVEAVRSNMVATALRPHTYGGLTAGRDSRVLLACTPPEIRSRTTYVTFDYLNMSEENLRDLHIADLLAKRHGLRHQVLKVNEASPEVRSSYFYRTGRAGSTNKSRDFYQTVLESLHMDAVWLTGFGGEVICMYYARDEDGMTRPSASELLHRVHQPEDHGMLPAIERWLSGFPRDYPNELIVELFYVENRVGSWACPHLYGAAPFFANIIPFCDRRYVEACYALPYAFRRSRTSQIRMIELADAALLKSPFEALTGVARLRRRLIRNRFYDCSRLFSR